MIELDAPRLHYLISLQAMIEATLTTERWRNSTGKVTMSSYGSIGATPEEDLDDQIQRLAALGLDECVISLERIKLCRVQQGLPGQDNAQMEALLTDFRSRLYDGLKRPLFLALTGRNKDLFKAGSPLFGSEVLGRFPEAADDVSEAGKCLALERGTATVFHLMRVMEAGLKALGAVLGITYAPSWEAYISQLNRLLDGKNWSNLTPEQKALRPLYQDALGGLTAVKSAWRNPTMHIVKQYDVSQATFVFHAVEGFMRHLASGLPPRGAPS
jgi:hypothetical protein